MSGVRVRLHVKLTSNNKFENSLAKLPMVAVSDLGGAMDEQSVKQAIEGREGDDTVVEIYGPAQLADSVIWEVWVEDAGEEFATRFLEEFEGGRHVIYDTFQALTVRLNKQHEAAMSHAKSIEWQRSLDLAAAQAKANTDAAESSRRLIEEQGRNALQAASLANQRLEQLVKLSMVGGGFIVGIFSAVYLIAMDKPVSSWAAGFILLCLLASAGRWAYGEWVTAKIPKPDLS